MNINKNTILEILKYVFLYYGLLNFLISFLCLVGFFALNMIEIQQMTVWILILFLFLCLGSVYYLNRKKITPLLVYTNATILALQTIIITLLLFLNKGSISLIMYRGLLYAFMPCTPIYMGLLFMNSESIFILMVCTSIFRLLFSYYFVYGGKVKRNALIYACILSLFICGNSYLYSTRPELKYKGHSFSYMHGYSSTDFSDYYVYSDNSKLVTLDHTPSLQIANKNEMPRLDGAEACYPVYAAIANAIYVDIANIEKNSELKDYYHNGEIVQFTNSVVGLDRLINGEIDMFFGAKPSKEQFEYADKLNIELEITPIGKEAFIFFVEEDNPINNLTSTQIRQIYSGEIDNFKDVGGDNQKIVAFQRPKNSGSQTMMEYFMKDVPLKEPLSYETIGAMEGVIRKVAEYNNEDGAMGYTFRYFLEGLQQVKNVKILQVDGIAPTIENIKNGIYPLTTHLCLITVKGNKNPNVEKVKEFILSKDGQEIIEKTGYAPLY